MSMDVEDFKVMPGKEIKLKSYDPRWVPKWAKKETANKKVVKEHALATLKTNKKQLFEMQELFWASGTYSMLIILQGMDAAGKDGTIKHVMSGINPQGCQITGFKTPSEEELKHDFLWRYTKALPERGRIGIFNRSYYEDVLIVKVRPEILEKQKLPPQDEGKHFWNYRYEDINLFERHLVRSGLTYPKISKKSVCLNALTTQIKNGNFRLPTFQNAQNGAITWKHIKRCLIKQAQSGHLGMLYLLTRNGLLMLQYLRLFYCK